MKQFLSLLLIIVVFVFIVSCDRSQETRDARLEDMKLQKQIVNAAYKTDGDSAAGELGERRFMRTASLKFKVNKVDDAVMDIENKTRELGGFVSLSQLKNRIQDSTSVSLSQDSSLQTIGYVTEGYIVLRVPDYRLDSLLFVLNPFSTMMLSREIHADDMRIQMLNNQLIHQRAEKTNQRIEREIDQKGKKLSEIEQAEKTMEEREESADNAKISNLTLDDAVRFSTVSIEIYQDPSIRYTEIARERKINEYETPFLYQAGESFSSGWQLLKDLVILLTKYWSIMLLFGIGYVVLDKYIRTNKKIGNSQA
jgi:hypothetical protein